MLGGTGGSTHAWSFSVSDAELACVRRGFDAANRNWVDADPCILAGTPASCGHAAPRPVVKAAVCELCGTDGELHKLVHMHAAHACSALAPPFLVSVHGGPAAPPATPPASPAAHSPLLRGAPLPLPDGGAASVMHAAPLGALLAALEAGLRLPRAPLSGCRAPAYVRALCRLWTRLHAHCVALAAAAPPPPPRALGLPAAAAQAAAAWCGLQCAAAAVDGSERLAACPLHAQLALLALQALPPSAAALLHVSASCGAAAAAEEIMASFTASSSAPERFAALADNALRMLAPPAAAAAEQPWLPVAVFAVSAQAACAVSAAAEAAVREGGMHDAPPDAAVLSLAAALRAILRALQLPALDVAGSPSARTCSRGAREPTPLAAAAAAGEAHSVSAQQWRAWLLVLLQTALDAAVQRVEGGGGGACMRSDGALQSALEAVCKHLATTKVRSQPEHE